MKKLYNNLRSLKALMLAMTVGLFAFNASAQTATVVSQTFPTGLKAGNEAKFTYKAKDFAAGTSFIFWNDKDNDGRLDADEKIIGKSTKGDNTDVEISFTVPGSNELAAGNNLNMAFAPFSGDTQKGDIYGDDNSERAKIQNGVTLAGSSSTRFGYTFNQTGLRQFTTDTLNKVASTEKVTLTVNISGTPSTANFLEVTYSNNGFTSSNVLTFGTNNDKKKIETAGTFNFVLPADAKKKTTKFRIEQKGTKDYGTSKAWTVNSLRLIIGNTYSQLGGAASLKRQQETVTIPAIVATAKNTGDQNVANGALRLFPGDVIKLEGTVAGIPNGNKVVAVLEDPDGKKTVLGSGDIDNTTKKFTVANVTVPLNIDYNSDNDWDIYFKAFKGDKPLLGLAKSKIDYPNRTATGFFDDDEAVKLKGGENNNNKLVFDEVGERYFSIAKKLNITGAKGQIELKIARKNDVVALAGTEVFVQYSKDGWKTSTDLKKIDLNTVKFVNNGYTTVKIEDFTAGSVSTTTQFRVIQKKNNGADLDAFVLSYFSIENESNIISDNVVKSTSIQNLDIEKPTVTLKNIAIGGDGKAYPGESLKFTYDITKGKFADNTPAKLYIDQRRDGINANNIKFDQLLATTANINAKSIDFKVPSLKAGNYNLYMVVGKETIYSSVVLTIYDLGLKITSVSLSNPVDLAGTKYVTPGNDITVNYSLAGTAGANAKVMLKIKEKATNKFKMIGEVATQANGTIKAKLPVGFDYTNDVNQALELSISSDDTLYNHASTKKILDFDNNQLNKSLPSKYFDKIIGETKQSNGSERFDQAGKRYVATVPMNVKNGGRVTVTARTTDRNANYTVLLEASIKEGEWKEIAKKDVNSNSFGLTLFSSNIPNGYWSDKTRFRVKYKEEKNENGKNVIEIKTFKIETPEAIAGVKATTTFKFLRPTLSVNKYAKTSFAINEEFTTKFNATAFEKGVEYAAVVRQRNEYYVAGQGKVNDNGEGEIKGNMPSVIPFKDNNANEQYKVEIVPFKPAKAGDKYTEGKTITFNKKEDYLKIEGSDENASQFQFDLKGDRYMLSKAFDLRTAKDAKLSFNISHDGGSYDLTANKNIIPRLEVSTDGGKTFKVVTVEDLKEDEKPKYDKGLLYEQRAYTIEDITVGNEKTHFRITQPLNLGAAKTRFYVSNVSLTINSGNRIKEGLYTTYNNPQNIDIEKPTATDYAFTQKNLQDPVFNNDEFDANFKLRDDRIAANVASFPAGSTFDFYLRDSNGKYIVDPNTDLPLKIASVEKLGDFKAKVPFYVLNGNYDVRVAVSIKQDGKKVYIVGKETEGDKVGTLAVFLRVVKTTIDFDKKDVLYAGSEATFKIDMENDSTNGQSTKELFATLLAKNFDGGDLVIATQKGIADMKVQLPPYLRNGNKTFEVNLSEKAPLGEPGDIIKKSDDLVRLEDKSDAEKTFSVKPTTQESIKTLDAYTIRAAAIYRYYYNLEISDKSDDFRIRLEYSANNGRSWSFARDYSSSINTSYERNFRSGTIRYRWRVMSGTAKFKVSNMKLQLRSSRVSFGISGNTTTTTDYNTAVGGSFRVEFNINSLGNATTKAKLQYSTNNGASYSTLNTEYSTTGSKTVNLAFNSNSNLKFKLIRTSGTGAISMSSLSVTRPTGDIRTYTDVLVDSPLLKFENTLGRGLITTRLFTAKELGTKGVVSYDLTYGKIDKDILKNQELIFEYSVDGGEKYVSLDTIPKKDVKTAVSNKNYKFTLTKEMKEKGAIFRFRQEERNNINVVINNFSIKNAEKLPFDYQSVTQNVSPQKILITSVNTEESCLDKELTINYELRGKFGKQNNVKVAYEQVGGNKSGTIENEFNVVGDNKTAIKVKLPSDVFGASDNNKIFKFKLEYADSTEYRKGNTTAKYNYNNSAEPFSDRSIEFVAPAKQNVSLTASNPRACESDSTEVTISGVQNYFTYDIIDLGDNNKVLKSTTYDPKKTNTNKVKLKFTKTTKLGVKVTAKSKSGKTTCGTIVSTATPLKVEVLKNFELYFGLNNAIQTNDENVNAKDTTVNICKGASITLSVRRMLDDGSLTVNGFSKVEWFRDNLNTPVGTGGTLSTSSFKLSGKYFARVTDGSCTYETGKMTVKIAEQPKKPVITVKSGKLKDCEGSAPVVLEAPAGFKYYKWSGSLGTTQSVKVEETANVTVQVSNVPFGTVGGGTCGSASESSNAVKVERYNLSEFSISSETTIQGKIGEGQEFTKCESGFIVYFFDKTTRTASNGTIEVLNATDNKVVGSTTSSSYTIKESGTYKFRWKFDDKLDVKCEATSVSVKVNIVEQEKVAPAITTSSDLSFCQGKGSVTITAPAGFAQYKWYKGTTVISGNAKGFDTKSNEIKVTTAGKYSVEVSKVEGDDVCWSQKSNVIEVNVRALPTYDIRRMRQNGNTCGEGAINFILTSTNDEYNYQLIDMTTGKASGEVVRGSGGTIFLKSASVAKTTNFAVKVSYADGEGCDYTTTTFKIGTPSNVVLELEGNNIAAKVQGTSRKINWFRNGVKLRNKVNQTSISVLDAAKYSVEVEFANACKITSNKVALDKAPQIKSFYEKLEAKPYPNPVTDVMNLSLKNGDLGQYDVTVTSLSGKVLLSQTVNKTKEGEQIVPINVSSLEAGSSYKLVIKRGNKIDSFTIIK